MKCKEGVSTSIENLQKEMLVLKVALQQKDLDIKSLKEVIEKKEEIISKSIVKTDEYIKNDTKMIEDLQQKIINEQQLNEQAEDEIIQLRIEIDNLRKEKQNDNNSKECERFEDGDIKKFK